MVKIAPSILAADFLHLDRDVRLVNDHADLLHFDVMDGCLVPNLSFGFPVMEAVAQIATIPLDVHLMIINPDKYIERFAKAGASLISFHLEAADEAGKDASEYIALAKSCGVKAGLAIDPDVEIERLFKYRNRQPWPTTIVKGPLWESLYDAQKGALAVLPTCDEAVEWANQLIERISKA